MCIRDSREEVNQCTMRYSNTGFNGGYTDHHYQDTEPAGMTISKTEVIQMAEDTLVGMGIHDMDLAEVLVGNQYNNNVGAGDESQQCYAFYFTRTIEDINTVFTQLTAWKTNAVEGSLPEDYRSPWTPEYIMIEVDNTGVVTFMWYNPEEITEIESKNVEIISLEEVMDKFADNMDIMVANVDLGNTSTNDLNISIDRIILGMQYSIM